MKKSIILSFLLICLISLVYAVTSFTVIINSPVNNTNTTDNTPDINFTVSGTENLYNCSFIVDNTLQNETIPITLIDNSSIFGVSSCYDGNYVYLDMNTLGLRAYDFDGSSYVLKDTLSTFWSGAYNILCYNDYIFVHQYDLGLSAITYSGTTFNVIDTILPVAGDLNSIYSDTDYIYTIVGNYEGLSAFTFDGNSFNHLNTTLYDEDVGITGNGTYLYLIGLTKIAALSFDGVNFTMIKEDLLSTFGLSIGLSIGYNDITNSIYVLSSNTGDNLQTITAFSFDGSTFSKEYTHSFGETISLSGASGIDVVGNYLGFNTWSHKSGFIFDSGTSFEVLLSNDNYGQSLIFGNYFLSPHYEGYSQTYVMNYTINNTISYFSNTLTDDLNQEYYINCTANSTTVQSETRTINIDATPPTINSNQTSITTPIYADTINISANVTDATAGMDYCNFTLTNPNSVNVIDNIKGTQSGDIWNSTNYQINVSGNWTVNITCADTFGNSVESIWTFRADLGNITAIPETKIYSNIAGASEVFNITLSHTGNNNNTIDFNLTGDISNATNFTITFDEDPATIEESETQYITINITTLNTLDDGIYTGNITWNRTEDGTNGVIEVTASISASVGNIYMTPETLSSGSMTSAQTIERILTINNTGNRVLENCNFSIDTGISTYINFSDESFDLDPNNETNYTMTVTTPPLGVYDATVTATCTATTTGGLDTDTSGFLAVVTAPVATGGGGGGIVITQVCGDNICSGSESILTCPVDCLVDFIVIPDQIEKELRLDGRTTGRLNIINNALFDKKVVLNVEPQNYLGFEIDGKTGYAIEVLIPKKSGLKSGEVYIDWDLNIYKKDLSFGDLNYTITISDDRSVVQVPAVFHVVEKLKYPIETVIPILILGIGAAIIGPALLAKYISKKRIKNLRKIINR